MGKVINRQIALKPQDLVVLLAALSRAPASCSYADLADATGMAASAVHASIKRAVSARLAMVKDRQPLVLKSQLKEFVLTGAMYAFPPVWGALTRGLPTSYAASPLNAVIAPSADPPPVWPHPNGPTRGMSLAPLYPSAPEAAMRDEKLYAMLALFDAIRAGQARERDAARKIIAKFFEESSATK
ncbi:MAG: AsnC family protein [Burkholderiales bacterium]|jgi:hypothetical protein|nr:MarR family transcriptional regulator [Nitrosomonadaceae bacterium]